LLEFLVDELICDSRFPEGPNAGDQFRGCTVPADSRGSACQRGFARHRAERWAVGLLRHYGVFRDVTGRLGGMFLTEIVAL
jgi:hypothetical protein